MTLPVEIAADFGHNMGGQKSSQALISTPSAASPRSTGDPIRLIRPIGPTRPMDAAVMAMDEVVINPVGPVRPGYSEELPGDAVAAE